MYPPRFSNVLCSGGYTRSERWAATLGLSNSPIAFKTWLASVFSYIFWALQYQHISGNLWFFRCITQMLYNLVLYFFGCAVDVLKTMQKWPIQDHQGLFEMSFKLCTSGFEANFTHQSLFARRWLIYLIYLLAHWLCQSLVFKHFKTKFAGKRLNKEWPWTGSDVQRLNFVFPLRQRRSICRKKGVEGDRIESPSDLEVPHGKPCLYFVIAIVCCCMLLLCCNACFLCNSSVFCMFVYFVFCFYADLHWFQLFCWMFLRLKQMSSSLQSGL